MFDGSDVASDFIHVPANVLEMSLQLGNTRFHYNVSIFFGAVFEVGLVLGASFGKRRKGAQWRTGFMALHGTPDFLVHCQNRIQEHLLRNPAPLC